MRFGVLGPVQVEREGSVIPLGGPQQRRLLGVLLAAGGEAISAGRLVDVLWPDGGASDGAERTAMSYVSRLRSALGDGVLLTVPTGYRLQGPTDAAEFETALAAAEQAMPDESIAHYERALALWRGPAFGDLAGEWWAVREATRLDERRSAARERLAAALIAIGHMDRAVPDLRALAVEQPLREGPVMLLMQALNALGRQAEALRVAHRFRAHLIEESGLSPSTELVELERGIALGGERTPGRSGGPLRGYTIHEVIGEGSFGRVYSATQPGTQRKVAIKVIRPVLADSAEFVRRFETEARLVARLEHPHIVPLYDYWREPGAAYLVFRYLGGGTAREAEISGGPWSIARTGRLVEEVGGALIAAHAAGVTHNDVKASNVMLDETGATYLTDFGIAAGDGAALADVDAVRRDTRCLGWLVWELLTGTTSQPAVPSTSVSHRLADGSAPSLRGRGIDVPEGLDAVLANATMPERGYADVAEFVLGWRAAVGRPDGVLTPVGTTPRPASDSARRLAAHRIAIDTAARVNPYKGLRPFDEADAATFHGRDKALGEVRRFVECHRWVAVVGPSGSGKSSVVRAGLVPLLRAEGFAVVVMVPGDDPVDALVTALSELGTGPSSGVDPVAELEALVTTTPVVIVVDQFEECWTVCGERRRENFLRLLLDSAASAVVTTVRADMLDRPLEHAVIGPLVANGAYLLPPMSASELEAAVTQPCRLAGVSIDEDLVTDIVAETLAQPGSLPMLQFVLAELYDHRVDAHIDETTMLAVGGLALAISRRAELVYGALDAHDRETVRDLFGRLVVPGDNTPDRRRRALQSELSPTACGVADHFVAARLLVADRHPATREPTVEVAHEALFERWERLAAWIADDRRWLVQLQHLALAATAWDQAGRGSAELYRGARLEAAIDAIESGRAVTETERAFVEAGRVARDDDVRRARRSARRLRRLLAGAAAALVLAITAGVLAAVQRQRAESARVAADDIRTQVAAERDEARTNRLVAESERLLPNQLDLAGLLAVEARHRTDTTATRGALITALAYTMPTATRAGIPSRFVGYIQPADDVVDGGVALDVSQDGRVVAVASWNPRGSQVRVYDVSSRRLLSRADAPLLVRDLDLSGDGHTVVGLLEPGPGKPYGLMVLDVASSTSTSFDIGPPVEGPTVTQEMRLTPDGQHAIVLFHDGSLSAWDIATHQRADLVLPSGPFHWFDLTPTGTLVTVDADNTKVTWSDVATGAVVRSQSLEAVDADLSDALYAISPDDRTLAVAQWQGPLFRWDLMSGATIPAANGQPDGVRNVAFDPAAATVLAVTTVRGELVFVDTASNGIIGEPVRVHGNGMRDVAFDASGRSMVAFADDRRISLWSDGSSAGLIDTPFTNDVELDHAVFSPDGVRALLYGGRAEIRRVDDADSPGVVIRAPGGANAGYFDARFSADGSRVVLGSDPSFVADTATGRPVWSIDALPRDLSPDGALAVVDRDGTTVELWAIDRDERLAAVRLADIGVDDTLSTTIQFSPDGTSVDFVAGGHAVRLSVPDLGLVSTVDSGRAQCTVAHMPATGFLVSMDGTGRVSQFDFGSGKLAGTGVSLDSTSICGVSTNADGSLVAAHQTFTNRVALFDGSTMRPVGVPIPVGRADGWFTPAFAGDGRFVGPGTAGGLAMYDVNPDHWEASVCEQAGRNLTADEWLEYIGSDQPYRATCPQWAAAG